jgi:hypothetical protein
MILHDYIEESDGSLRIDCQNCRGQGHIPGHLGQHHPRCRACMGRGYHRTPTEESPQP